MSNSAANLLRISDALDLTAKAVLSSPTDSVERGFYLQAYRMLYEARNVARTAVSGAIPEEIHYAAQ